MNASDYQQEFDKIITRKYFDKTLEKTRKEAFWGGWTCKKCKARISVNFFGKITGYKLPKKKSNKKSEKQL